MIKVTVHIYAEDYDGVRLAMRQAYQRDLNQPLVSGKYGQTPYRLEIVNEVILPGHVTPEGELVL